jgi:hypothetical protein
MTPSRPADASAQPKDEARFYDPATGTYTRQPNEPFDGNSESFDGESPDGERANDDSIDESNPSEPPKLERPDDVVPPPDVPNSDR